MFSRMSLPNFNRRSDAVSLATILLHLSFVLTPIYLGAVLLPGPRLLFLWLWFGLAMNGLLNLMHECAHYLVFKPRWGSDFLGRWVLAPLAFADFDGYRRRHWAHHQHLGRAGDTKDAYLVSIWGWDLLWFFLRCLLMIEAFRKFRHQTSKTDNDSASPWGSRIWMGRVLIVQGILFGSLLVVAWRIHFQDLHYSFFVSGYTYLGVYAYGLMSLTVFAATLRAIAEHQVGVDHSAAVGHAALRNLASNPLSRLLLGAYGFSEHATHHWQPSIPYYHLPAATTTAVTANPALAPQKGYFVTLLQLIKGPVCAAGLKDLEEFFDRMAPERDRWRRRNKLYYEDLNSFLQFLVPPNLSVLVVGSGTGDLLHRLKPGRGVGVDISSAMIAVAKKKYPHLHFVHSAAENLSLTEKFDYVILLNLVGYAVDVQKVFEKVQSVCTPSTRVIVTYYNYLWEPLLKLAEKLCLRMPQPQQNWLSLADLENLFNLTGFEVVKKGERFIWPLPIPLIASFFNKMVCKMPLVHKLCLTNFLIARPGPTRTEKMPPYSCSVIVPARNEKGNILQIVERIPAMGTFTEVVFVEGHSSDGTGEEIEQVLQNYKGNLRLKFLVQDGEGKGDAVRKGFGEAQGDILMILDADLTVPPEELPKFFGALAAKRGEFINGSRLVYQMENQAMRNLNLLANKCFSLLFTWLLDQRLKDTLCGTKALFKGDYLKIEANRSFFGEFDPFGDFDLLFGASKLNLKIVEIPIRYRERSYGSTNIRRFKHGWLLLKMCLVAARRLKFC